MWGFGLVHGGNIAFKKSIFEKTGLFNSEVGRIGTSAGCGEETEMCLRIRAAIPNTKILYEDQAVIHHSVPQQRLTWSYLIQRSYNEGFCKKIIKKSSHNPKKNVLSTENYYLHYLLSKSIPGKLARFWNYKNISQAIVILVCMIATAFGYLSGR